MLYYESIHDQETKANCLRRIAPREILSLWCFMKSWGVKIFTLEILVKNRIRSSKFLLELVY